MAKRSPASEEYTWHALRSALTALAVGGSVALTTWAGTDDLKAVVIAGGTAALGIILSRLGVEAPLDARAAGATSSPRLVPPAQSPDTEERWGKPL